MDLDTLRGWMAGEHCLVVAPGPSATYTPRWRYQAHWTIGCNRAVTFCQPDFAICMETRKNACWKVIESHPTLFTFTHITDAPARCLVINSDLHLWLEGTPKKLWLGMSPFHGAAVALHLGFDRIGLIGVDLDATPDGRFSDTGKQEVTERAWEKLMIVADSRGVDLVNLNPRSKLRAVPTGAWKDMGQK